MTDRTERAKLKWPNVPDVYGWLSLDGRGQWRIKAQRVTRAQIIETINAHYQADARGCWFYQNGPQRVFVALETAPLIARAQPDGRLLTHTGTQIASVEACALDENGALWLRSGCGAAQGAVIVDGDELHWALARLTCKGNGIDDQAVLTALAQPDGARTALTLRWGDRLLPVERIDFACVPERWGFVRAPQRPLCGSPQALDGSQS